MTMRAVRAVNDLMLWVRPWRLKGPNPKWYRAYSIREYRCIPEIAGRPPAWMARVVIGGTNIGKHPNVVDVDLSEMVLSSTQPTDGPFETLHIVSRKD